MLSVNWASSLQFLALMQCQLILFFKEKRKNVNYSYIYTRYIDLYFMPNKSLP